MIKLSNRLVAMSLGSIAMLGACRGTNRSAAGDTTARGTYQPGSLEGIRADSAAGGVGMSDASPTQTAVEANMRAMMGASSGQLQTLVPQHRQLVTSMIGQMNHEMGSMHTPASAAWMATRDSVDRDLMQFSTMSARDIQAMLPAHQARVTRLMQMQRGTMGRMMPNR